MPRSFNFVCQLYCCSSKHSNKALRNNSCKTVSTSSMALATVNIDKIIKVTSASSYVYVGAFGATAPLDSQDPLVQFVLSKFNGVEKVWRYGRGRLMIDSSVTGTNWKVEGGTHFLVVPLHFFGSTSTISRLVMVNTDWSVSCGLFFYSWCPGAL